jgi:hypothetical protein
MTIHQPCCIGPRVRGTTHIVALHWAGQRGSHINWCACCYCCTAQEYQSQYDMVWLSQQRSAWLALMGDRVHDTVTFTDNHDLPRWLHANYSSISRFK